ncbi:PAAR domain-containing protein [Methylobacterium sp. Gmos1]
MPGHRVAHVGSPLDHGGTVTTGSSRHSTNGGKPVARVGDAALCARHGPVVITTGSARHTVDGKACARVTSLCSCGARITDGSPRYTCD